MISWIKRWGDGLADMLWPRVCAVCGQTLVSGERTMCLKCQMELPVTNVHRETNNPIHLRLVSSNVPIDKAASYFYYAPESPYAQLLVSAKYHRQPWLDKELATHFAHILQAEGWFDDIDAILPVPMHPWKKWRRGYNQAEVIAHAIGAVADIPTLDNLICIRRHGTQTRLGRLERLRNASHTYAVEYPGELDNLHLLVVDDIITSGATMLSCCQVIVDANPSARLSVLSLGLTKER